MTAIATPAVMVRKVTWGEADLIVTLYTRQLGKVSANARAARRSRRRFGAGLALFVAGEAFLKERPGQELMALERFEVRRDFPLLSADIVRMAHASYATELLRELTVQRQPDPALFDLIVELYRTTATLPLSSDTLRAFELRLMDELGFRPVLDRCLRCGASDSESLDAGGAVVDPGQGGLLCPRCAAAATGQGVRPLPAAARLRLLEAQAVEALPDAARLPPLEAEVCVRAREAMHALISAHLGSPLKSLSFFQQLRGA